MTPPHFQWYHCNYRIENKDGLCIHGLDDSNFVIKEKIQGGEYLSREVKEAEILEGKSGVSISLVADKSGSISEMDMVQIKYVM